MLLPPRFTALDDTFFSLGQDDTYYERLRQLGDSIRVSVLAGLRDMPSTNVPMTSP
ncbi:hypothetical protein ACFYNW_23935 [Streptomyces virginiae]|uniref:hypothetical protein n=1 Tax=Streptomyces virginiae TaxID=1961 RepID=UPI0036E0CDFB